MRGFLGENYGVWIGSCILGREGFFEWSFNGWGLARGSRFLRSRVCLILEGWLGKLFLRFIFNFYMIEIYRNWDGFFFRGRVIVEFGNNDELKKGG